MWFVLTWTNSSLLFGWCYVVCADLDQFFIAARQCYVVCADLDQFFIAAWMVLYGVC